MNQSQMQLDGWSFVLLKDVPKAIAEIHHEPKSSKYPHGVIFHNYMRTEKLWVFMCHRMKNRLHVKLQETGYVLAWHPDRPTKAIIMDAWVTDPVRPEVFFEYIKTIN